MKTWKKWGIALFGLIIPFLSSSQPISRTRIFNELSGQGGAVTIKQSSLQATGSNIQLTFEVECSKADSYYLNAWMMGAKWLETGRSREYTWYVNDTKMPDKILTETSGWQSVQCLGTAIGGKIELIEGKNTIAFSSMEPEIPEVEFIRMAKVKADAAISDLAYKEFIAKIGKKEQQQLSRRSLSINENKLSTTAQEAIILPNPKGIYYHYLNVPFKYTTYKTIYLKAGSQYSIYTVSRNGHRHVLEVFHNEHSETASWSVASNFTTGNATLNITIGLDGYYILKVRSYTPGEEGIVDLYVKRQGDLFTTQYANCPVTGTVFRDVVLPANTMVYDNFTCNLRGDSFLWLEEKTWTQPGPIRAYNDDYIVVFNHPWFAASRIRRVLSHNIGGVWLSAATTTPPNGTCDVYIGCPTFDNLDMLDYFPELTELDAILSAPATTEYNCISWSGGITGYWEWPADSTSEYFTPGGDLACFDKFYASERYPGCMKYTRTGATANNSIVDLWGLYWYNILHYTHASVRKPANNHPHGYDWESKLGGLERIFHPRNSLKSFYSGGDGYGEIMTHYIQDPSQIGTRTILLDESVAEGLSAIEQVQFTIGEKATIETLKENLSSTEKELFEEKYQTWVIARNKPELKLQSNPRKFAESEEYTALTNYCRSKEDRIWPMIYEKYEQGDFFLSCLLEDLIIPRHKDLLAEVKTENKAQKYTQDGRFIVRSSYGNGMKFLRKLLENTQKAIGQKTRPLSTADNGLLYSNTDPFELSYNRESRALTVKFGLERAATVSLSVYNLNGREINRLIESQLLHSGSHSVTEKISWSASPVCLVKFRVNKNVNIQKIQITP